METSHTSASHADEAALALKKYFGFDSFRGLQKTIIDDLVQGKDLLVLMPTGGGKSLCYQIPALIRRGVAIVVSPLIALMEDQVAALKALGVRAAYYNSSLSGEEAKQVLSQLHHEALDLLYIAPERLVHPAFLERLKQCELALFAIDEAHCISQWGHDFRPEYSTLGLLKTHFPCIPVIALTATADQQTRTDIIARLNYAPTCYVASFNRPNIHYRVLLKNNPGRQLLQFLNSQAEKAGIIYCSTRNGVERLAEKLKDEGLRARAYHAGLSHEERRQVQTLFRHDEIDIVVATIAFGMGIDKPNVRFVVHYDLPKSIESYYQETGRAGRDGLPAQALLLFDPADSARLRAWIAASDNEGQQRVDSAKLNHMLAFAEAAHCRRQILLNYFDESTPASCNYCDVCDHPPRIEEATEEAQKLLSCIYRLRQGYGMSYTIEVLRGVTSEKIKTAHHDQLSTFGIGRDRSAHYWKHLAWQLIHRGYCYQDISQFNVLRLTQKAIPVLRGEERVSLTLPAKDLPAPKSGKKAVTCLNDPLFEKLRQLRRELAQEEDKPPFMIFSDMTLQEMVDKKPATLMQLRNITGVGQYKLERYGQQFLGLLNEHNALA
ncbi:DNA helicase RecQ [Legionella erythra]|uniref:DNA helicase RecQ n=1 Tax=Legionella erythra TaxID=448 RepID=A0A0W0TFW8_LEGER|nr:DNA helicase RecQ [Legionella erythra]KTC94511.1 ATP-dependent DNA helicase RecQ [Legionella erythra]